ncbi:uncharacterized protein LOC124457105, partial [Xenia sp. Carnegie-2017]|uniref:uncharacterized protein LOC124457105 n=1 Tax=Xenia sp. Carnegie-2017 TaxID=2897299 RepID=UPI001F042AE4
YLIQTESCLHEHLMSTAIFVQKSKNNVLVLSFESICTKKNLRQTYNIQPFGYPFLELLPVSIHFDAACNAFHKNAIKFLLPYRLMYENRSWHDSQKFLIMAADLIFRGQIVHILPVTTTNAKHRAFPKNKFVKWAHL